MAEAKGLSYKIEWKIDNVTREKLDNDNFELWSVPFTAYFDGIVTKWKFRINSKVGYKKRALSVWLYNVFADHDDFRVCFDARVKNPHDGLSLFADFRNYKVNEGYERSQVIELDKLFNKRSDCLDENGSMTLLIDFLFIRFENDCSPPKKRRSTFLADLRDPSLADYTLTSSDGVSYKVVRYVLSRSCDYFLRLFTANKQKTNMPLQLRDETVFYNINAEVLETIIDFICTGTVDFDDDYEYTKEVLNAAHYLGFHELKAECVKLLLPKLNENNAIEMFKIADKKKLTDLQSKSLDVIMNFYDQIKESEDFKSLDASLKLKILDAFACIRTTIKFHSVL